MKLILLLALVALLLVLPALVDNSEHPQLGSGSRVTKTAAPFVAAPSPSEHRMVGLSFELVRATRPRPRARTAPTYRSQAVGAIPDLIRSVFARFGSAVAEEAVLVARCESGFDPHARLGPNVGVMQLNGEFHRARAARLGFSWEQVATEALPNITVAADLYADSGWVPWACRKVLR